VHFHFALGGWPFFFDIFTIFVRISWGIPAIYFADFGPFLDHFWAFFFFGFFAEKIQKAQV